MRALLPPGRGRGSSVSSIVCYLTGLSHIDPIANELFLGRFLNEEITALPDIDLDFPRDVRAELIPRIHEIYGHEHSRAGRGVPDLPRARRDPGAGQGARPAAGGDRARRALVGGLRRAQGVDEDIDDWRWARAERQSSDGRRPLGLAGDAGAGGHGLPRHLSQHSGGMIVATRPLVDCCPVVPAAMEGRQMVMWDKDSCADAGFLKIDLLGLGMLSAVERCVERSRRDAASASTCRGSRTTTPTRSSAIQTRRDDRRLPDREPRADGVAAAHAPEEPRRPHDPGGDRAPGADPGRRGQPLHRAPAAAAGRPVLRDPLRAPVARGGPRRTRSGRSSSRTR